MVLIIRNTTQKSDNVTFISIIHTSILLDNNLIFLAHNLYNYFN